MASEKIKLPVAERPVEDPTPSPSTQEHGQTLKKSSSFEKITSLFDNWYYAWEILGIFLSGAAIVAICIVVHHFNGREVPMWIAYAPGRAKPFQLTINSLLSILSVLGSTCAMIPVTKGLGQLKYLWFMEQDRKLADLEVFDSASRGKVGSAQLIWKLRFKHLAVLGGLASLLALAYGPFVQNLLVVGIEYRPADNNALLSYTFSYSWEPINPTGNDTDSPLRFSVEQAIKDASEEWAIPAHKCKTGECSWKDYYTLAACSRCTDISHLLKRTCTPVVTNSDGFSDTGGCNVALPNGLSFNSTDLAGQNQNPHRITMVMNTTMQPLVHNYTSPLAFVQSIMGLPHGDSVSNTSKPFIITQDSPVVAHECAIIPCVQRQSLTLTRFTEGTDINPNLPATEDIIPVMDITETFDNYMAREDGYVVVDFKDPGENKNISEQQKGTYSQPTFLPSTYAGIRYYLNTMLNGYVWSSADSTEYSIHSLGPVVSSFHGHTLNHSWSPFYCEGNETSQEGVPCGMNKIAAGLTNAFRLWAWQMDDDGNRAVFNGTTNQAEQICTAQWQYVSAPVAVWVLGLALFIGVVIKTRRANIMAWRTSPLATLLLRLDPDSREHLKDWQHMGDAELKAMAQELRLRLQIDESGPRFVRETA